MMRAVVAARASRRSLRQAQGRLFDYGRAATLAQDDNFMAVAEKGVSRLLDGDVVEEAYPEFELGAVELLWQGRELAFAGDTVPRGFVEGSIA